MKKIILIFILTFSYFVGYSQISSSGCDGKRTKGQIEKWIRNSKKYTYTGDKNILRVFVRHQATMIKEKTYEKEGARTNKIINAFTNNLEFEEEHDKNCIYTFMHLPYRDNNYYWEFLEESNVVTYLKHQLEWYIVYNKDEEANIEELYIYRGKNSKEPNFILESHGSLKGGFSVDVYSDYDDYKY